MDQAKIGKFIGELRKEKKLKQAELAEKLGVTSKTVSRWETGKYMPDLSLFTDISQILGVTPNFSASSACFNFFSFLSSPINFPIFAWSIFSLLLGLFHILY